MPDAVEVWNEALPYIRRGVTGVGVWAALNASRAVTIEEGLLIVGLPHSEQELAGHLRLPQTKRLMDLEAAKAAGVALTVRVIDGVTLEDWQTEKQREAERKRLHEQAHARARAKQASTTNWDTLYEQLSRNFAAVKNRSLPQNRAKYLLESVEILAQALQSTPITDEQAERSFARCIERIAQHAEIPSALVAVRVLEKAFNG